MREITSRQYNKIMDKIIKLNDKLEINEQLIKMLEEASKYVIKAKQTRKVKSRNL